MPGVVEFLIADLDHPRSMRSCVRGADESIHSITGTSEGTFQNVAERRLGQLKAAVDYTDIEKILTRGFHEFLEGLQIKLIRAGDAIDETFFDGTSTAQQVLKAA